MSCLIINEGGEYSHENNYYNYKINHINNTKVKLHRMEWIVRPSYTRYSNKINSEVMILT